MLRSLTQRWFRYETLGCILTAIFLTLSHPTADIWILAWVALVPLLLALDGKKPSEAFRIAYFCGLLFFTGSLYWFFNIARWFSFIGAIGIILLMIYLSMYFGLFGLAYAYFSRLKSSLKLFVLPSVWVALEFIRAHLFTGFDWVSLGHSQYLNTTLIQIAEYTGVFGISFMVMMGNVLAKEIFSVWKNDRDTQGNRTIAVLIFLGSLVIVPVLLFGAGRISSTKQQPPTESDYRVAIIQANIPQEVKWDQAAGNTVMEQYLNLTRQAAAHQPDLIIWPETSHPNYLWDDKELFVQLQAFVKNIQIPLIVGSVLKEDKNYYNTAILLSGSGDVEEIYRKVHLVPFGEYLPLRKLLPLIAQYVGIGDFTAGTKWTVFKPQPAKDNPAFSVLICFEDTVARVARQFVTAGAAFLVNITNDAWFGDTKAPYMHLQSAVFRTVENRRSLVRAANTGVSCFINQWGEATQCVEEKITGSPRKTYISGYSIEGVDFGTQKTFYTKFGDVFTIVCFGCILWGIIRRMRISNLSKP